MSTPPGLFIIRPYEAWCPKCWGRGSRHFCGAVSVAVRCGFCAGSGIIEAKP